MTDKLNISLQELTDIQRKAVDWNDEPLLVLAGPGSGKTRVLTTRIARILEQSPKKNFRILALTFTNRAVHEMKTRVANLVPGLEERAAIFTFHGFCTKILRQHGAHIGIKSNFEIYSRKADREALLEDVLKKEFKNMWPIDINLLKYIDSLKTKLIKPEEASIFLQENAGMDRQKSEHIGLVYQLYEEEMNKSNALDFNSLLYYTRQLMRRTELRGLYKTIYRYWCIDEFQDTNGTQYELLKQMAGNDFRRLFVVADDDQTIYEWNGAHVRRIKCLVNDFGCEVIQLTDNFRCPRSIVDAANRLMVYNVRRDKSKHPARATKVKSDDNNPAIQCLVHNCDEEEVSEIVNCLANLNPYERGKTAVLARTNALLGPIRKKLEEKKIPNSLMTRKDDFSSPQMRWIVACLKQINRPQNKRNLVKLNETFRSFTEVSVETEDIIMHAETELKDLLTVWIESILKDSLSCETKKVVDLLRKLNRDSFNPSREVKELIECLKPSEFKGDFKEDVSAWNRIVGEIQSAGKGVSLERFLQGMELRSKEPTPRQNSVSLGTIHSIKGMEFKRVYFIGLAQEICPSWHSVKNPNGGATIEEERRGCFVAITRASEQLVLSRAKKYNNWPKDPSQFLGEMGLYLASS